MGGFIEVDEVFVEVKAGRGQQRACVVVQVGGYALTFFFLQADGGVEEHFLLFLFEALELHLVADDLSLVEDDEDDQPDGEDEHADGAEVEYQGELVRGGVDL